MDAETARIEEEGPMMTDCSPDLIAASEREERLSTAACARALGVSTAFIRGEIRDGRLRARILKPKGRQRAAYRIDRADFEAYLERCWPHVSRGTHA